MTQYLDGSDPQLEAALLTRLRRMRDRDGSLPNALVRQAAAMMGCSDRTVRRKLARPADAPDESEAYRLTADDVALYFLYQGNVSAVWRDRVKQGLTDPSRQTLDRAFRDPTQMTARDRAYAKHGVDGARQAEIALRREVHHRNEVWEADHKELPIEVIGPRGIVFRPWVTIFEDAFSRAIMGWSMNDAQTAADVHAAMRKSIEIVPGEGPFGGVPDVVVWDNGKEFLAHSVTDMCHRLGIFARPTMPHQPTQKGKIERLNRTIEQEFLTGKPGFQNGARSASRRLLGTSARMHFEQLLADFHDFVLAYNQDRRHSAIKSTPAERWRSDPTPIAEIEPERLRILSQTVAKRIVGREGIEIMGHQYKDAALLKLRGETLVVRHMPHDPRSIDVYDGDRFVATIAPADAMSQEDRDAFLAEREEERKKAERARRSASRKQRARMAPNTGPGAPQQTLVVGQAAARAAGITRLNDGLSRGADLSLITDEDAPATLPDLDDEETR